MTNLRSKFLKESVNDLRLNLEQQISIVSFEKFSLSFDFDSSPMLQSQVANVQR